jgi:hypothetical protein
MKTTIQIFAFLSFLLSSTLLHADFTVNDGGYLIVSNSLSIPNYYLLTVTDPQNGRLGVSASSPSSGSPEASIASAPGYLSHNGSSFQIKLSIPLGVTCTIDNIDANNPLAANIKNCASGLRGTFTLLNLPYTNGTNKGSYQWSVIADFDANGVGSFNLSPIAQPSDQFVTVARPNISSFQATWAQLLMMLY